MEIQSVCLFSPAYKQTIILLSNAVQKKCVSHICNYKISSSHITKPKKKQVKLILKIFYLIQNIQHIISISIQYKKLSVRYFTFLFFTKSLKFSMYFVLDSPSQFRAQRTCGLWLWPGWCGLQCGF